MVVRKRLRALAPAMLLALTASVALSISLSGTASATDDPTPVTTETVAPTTEPTPTPSELPPTPTPTETAPVEPDTVASVSGPSTPGPSTFASGVAALTVSALTVSGLTITQPDGAIVWSLGGWVEVAGTSTLRSPVSVKVDGRTLAGCSWVTPTGAPWWSSSSNDSFTWHCFTPVGPPGLYTLVAQQFGSPDATRVVTVAPPTLKMATGTIVTDFGDAVTVAGWGGFPSAAVTVSVIDTSAGCSTTAHFLGGWSCNLDVTGLAPGDYVLRATQAFGGVTSAEITRTLRILGPPGVACSFAPAAAHITGLTPGGAQLRLADDASAVAWTSFACGSGWATGLPNAGWSHVTTCNNGCNASDLVPGLYEIHNVSSGPGSKRYDTFFRVPVAPLIALVMDTEVTEDGPIQVSGIAVAGDHIVVSDDGGDPLCTATASGGTWSCSFDRPADPTDVKAVAIDPTSGGMSALSAASAIPAIVVAPTPTATATPTPTPTPTPTITPTPTVTPTPTPTPSSTSASAPGKAKVHLVADLWQLDGTSPR